MKALLLIDLQNDFCANGALEVPDGDAVIPIANALMEKFDWVIATQDWHPADHGSFAAMHPWRNPGAVIDLHGLPQVLWPIHCVQGSFGAELVAGLDQSRLTKVFVKGTDPTIDSYSGFFDNGHRKATGLADYLHAQGIDTLYVVGLATDYCVKHTVLDGLDLGFKIFLVVDGCRGVNLQPGDVEAALATMLEKGAQLITADAV